jgi:hypothetical protein
MIMVLLQKKRFLSLFYRSMLNIYHVITVNCGRQCMTDFKVGQYYRAEREKDVILITAVMGGTVDLRLVENPDNWWIPGKVIYKHIYIIYNYKHLPCYGTKLWKAMYD